MFILEKENELELTKSNIIETKEILPRGWRVSFKITPRGYVKEWSSVLHATIGGDTKVDGDCTPAIWFRPNSLKPLICSSVNGNRYYCYTLAAIPLNKETTIRVQQVQSPENHLYYYEIFINDKRIHNDLNKNPRVFHNVKYYASDPWYPPAFATIKDFKLETYEHTGKADNLLYYTRRLSLVP